MDPEASLCIHSWNIPAASTQEKVGRNRMKGPVRLSFGSSRQPQSCRQGQTPGKEDSERHSPCPWRLRSKEPAGRYLPQILRTLGVEAVVPLPFPLLWGQNFPHAPWWDLVCPGAQAQLYLGRMQPPRLALGAAHLGRTCQAQPALCVTPEAAPSILLALN